MVSITDVEPKKLIGRAAEELKKSIKMPGWAIYIKTGVHNERPPEQKDWWYTRAASMLRHIYLKGPLGVSKLRKHYGGLHRRGHKPAHTARAGGKVIRTILQDLERLQLIEKIEKPKKGRKISPQGQKFLSGIAKSLK